MKSTESLLSNVIGSGSQIQFSTQYLKLKSFSDNRSFNLRW